MQDATNEDYKNCVYTISLAWTALWQELVIAGAQVWCRTVPCGGYAVAQLVEALRHKSEGRWFDPSCCQCIFHWHNPSSRTMALGVDSASTETSTRNISWVVKAAGAYGRQPYHLPVPTVLESGSLNLLEPSRPVQTCSETALPYLLPFLVEYLVENIHCHMLHTHTLPHVAHTYIATCCTHIHCHMLHTHTH